MKKKNLKGLPFKKSTISNLLKNRAQGGTLPSEANTGCCNPTAFFCPSEQTCQTFDIICQTAFLCGSQNPLDCNDSINYCF
ncbi:hypothetical protein [Ascidiimonas sp. W6]|uniref:hypothetical protein n=1 Tax=Ascidiimonas meishanensis TaxID=3128903 RepID=UPI0030EED720